MTLTDKDGVKARSGDIVLINVNYGLYGHEAWEEASFIVIESGLDGIELVRLGGGNHRIDKSWLKAGKIIGRVEL